MLDGNTVLSLFPTEDDVELDVTGQIATIIPVQHTSLHSPRPPILHHQSVARRVKFKLSWPAPGTNRLNTIS
jgi:hypothetical protein